MKRKPLAMMAALPMALLLACAASAQQAPAQPQPQSPPQPMPQTQPMPQAPPTPAVPTTTQTRQCASGTNCYDNNATDRDTGGTQNMRGQSFLSLAGSKGYVTQTEARKDAWLSSRFPQCDTNGDGKLTRSEYRKCRQPTSGGQP